MMRVSCSGCRVLRKGCDENCILRPCLAWIKNAESQANAILFLAKFYGRTGLLNLLNSGPENLRPEIFRSLLQEACGRIVNPISGSVGLSSSGNWQLCQAAVETVLRGDPIIPISSDAQPPIKSHYICRSDEDDSSAKSGQNPGKPKRRRAVAAAASDEPNRSSSHVSSSLSHRSEPVVNAEGSGGTRMLLPAKPKTMVGEHDAVEARGCGSVELELRLGGWSR